MSTLATLVVKLVGDVSEFEKQMEASARRTQEWGKKIESVGRGMTTFVTLPLIAAGGAAVKFASDASESLNKVNVVFGDAAGQVEQFAKGAAANLGMSSQAAMEAAGTFGNLFTALGLGQAPAAQMSTELLTLAADLASFNNIDPAEALEKLRSGLVGEAEPLRSLGVNLTEVAVKTKAMEMGLAATEKALTPAMLVQARYALILEQTGNAQGDFARTSDGLANRMRILKARLVDAGASIGTLLLPYALRMAEAAQGLLERIQGLSPETLTLIVKIGALAAAIGPVLIVVGRLISLFGSLKMAWMKLVIGIGTMGLPVIAAIAGIAAVVGVLALAWKNNWGGMRDSLTAWWTGTVQPLLQQVWQWLQVNIPLAIQAVSAWWTGTMLPAIQAVFLWIQANVFPILAEIWNWLAVNVPLAIQAVSAWWTGTLLPAIQAVSNWIQTQVIPVFQAIWNWLSTNIPAAIQAVSAWWTGTMLPALQAIWGFIQGYILPIWSALAGLLTTAVGVAVTALAGLWQNVLQPALQAVGQAVQVVANYFMTGLSVGIQKVWSLIQIYLLPIFERLKEFISTSVMPVLDRLGSFVGETLVKAFDGLKQAIQWVVSQIKALTDKLANLKLPDWLTPGSPTPFEYGLRGIADAMEDLRRMELPAAFTIGRGAAANSSNVTFNQTVYTNAPASNVISDFQRARAMA